MRRGLLDRFGVMLSGLCLVHCLAGLVLVGLLGLGGGVLLDPAIHHIGLALALTISALTLGTGAVLHRRHRPLLPGISGLALMTGALFAPHGAAEAGLTMAGVVLVATAHVINMRHGHQHD